MSVKDPTVSKFTGNVRPLTILGCGSTHAECDYTKGEIWGVNGTYTFAKKLDKLFMTDTEEEVATCWYDVVKLVKAETTLILPAPYKKFMDLGLNIELFPIDKIMERFPTRFYSNTIAYMLAYALFHTNSVQYEDDLKPRVISGYNPIYFYGIDMLTHSTYIQEKGGVEYWMGIAFGMGVQVINTRGSATGKTYNGKMYGAYGEWEEEQMKEGTFMPFDMMRVSKAANPQPEYIYNPVSREYQRYDVPLEVRVEKDWEKNESKS